MLDDIVFAPSETTLKNLSTLADSGARITERRACEISELADGMADFSKELYSEGMGVYEILSLAAESISGMGTHHTAGGLALETAHEAFISSFDRAELATLFVDRLRASGIDISPSDLLPSAERDGRIVYVKNALADEAYDVFTADVENARVSYAASFKEAAGAVADGEASYCLLPLEERGGSRLAPVSEIIFRRDLRICAITPVFGFDGNADMKYALLSSGYSVPELSSDDDGYLEVRISADEGASLSELITVASYYGISVYRINTQTFNAEDFYETYHDVVFRSSGVDFTQLLVYLTLFSSAYVPIGMYKNLE